MSEEPKAANLIDLAHFKDEHPGLWLDGDKVIASDGHILFVADVAAVKDGEHVKPWSHPRRAAVRWEAIMDPMADAGGWAPLPNLMECDTCKGTGETTKDCNQCNGFGEHECSCGHTHDCGYCDGEGDETAECRECRQELFGVPFVRQKLNHLVNLPGIEIGAREDVGKSRCVCFRFTGGTGVVMGLMG